MFSSRLCQLQFSEDVYCTACYSSFFSLMSNCFALGKIRRKIIMHSEVQQPTPGVYRSAVVLDKMFLLPRSKYLFLHCIHIQLVQCIDTTAIIQHYSFWSNNMKVHYPTLPQRVRCPSAQCPILFHQLQYPSVIDTRHYCNCQRPVSHLLYLNICIK